MRTYAKISPQFWIGQTGKKLRKTGPEAQLVALYLITNPHANMLGVYHLPVAYMAHDLGCEVGVAMKGLSGCADAGFCNYDEATETVWIYEMARFQIGDSLKSADNRVAGIQKEYDDLHENPFLQGFFEKYGSAFCLTNSRDFEAPSEVLRSHFKGVLKGDQSPLEPPSEGEKKAIVHLREGGSEEKGSFPLKTPPVIAEARGFEAPSEVLRSQEQEQEQEQEQDLKTFAPSDFSKSEKSSKPETDEKPGSHSGEPQEDPSSPLLDGTATRLPHQRIRLDAVSIRWKGILPEDIERWKETYPAVDVEQQLREMEVWASAHRSQWKSNWLRFIVHWLSKEQDKGGTFRRSSNPEFRTTPKTFEQIKAERTHTAAKQVLDEIYGPQETEASIGTISV